MWNCICDCGKTKILRGNTLLTKNTKSCGCLRIDTYKHPIFTTHGLSSGRIYEQWKGIKKRCYNSKGKQYKDYGGRGINVCDDWKNSFLLYFKWAMENGYSETLSIDRINNENDYCPENCKFSTSKEQNNNKRNNINITINGIIKTVPEWSEYSGVGKEAIYYRYYKGIIGQDLLKPVTKRRG